MEALQEVTIAAKNSIVDIGWFVRAEARRWAANQGHTLDRWTIVNDTCAYATCTQCPLSMVADYLPGELPTINGLAKTDRCRPWLPWNDVQFRYDEHFSRG